MTDVARSEGEALERYETILKNIHDGVYTLDADGHITWVNETAVREIDIGYTRDELVGAHVSKVLADEDIEKSLEIIQTLLRDDDRESGRCEVAIQTAYGTEIPCDLHLSLLLSSDGELQGTVGVLRDITERIQREQRLTVLNRVLRHNLRNDMSLILGPAEHLEASLDGPDVEQAALIRERGETLLGLAEKARRIEETLEDYDRGIAPLDVVEIVRDRIGTFRRRYPDATFAVDAPDQQWAIANETLAAALDELLENAIEHDDGLAEVAISVSMEERSDSVTIRVEDRGPWIPEDEIEVLEAGDETQLRHSSGLGLWFVHWLANSYGGGLSFEHRDAGGNITTIRLKPASPDDER